VTVLSVPHLSAPDFESRIGGPPADWACLDIALDGILRRGPLVCSGRDGEGTRYLIAEVAPCRWLCVAISELALLCVAMGRADVREAFAHSPTGMVEQVTRHPAGRYITRTRAGDELLDTELPPPGLRVAA
jgi:hypothetical protein